MKMKKQKRNQLSRDNINVNKKKQKKPKLSNEPISSLCNIVGITSTLSEADHNPFSLQTNLNHGDDDLDDCLALMDQTINDQIKQLGDEQDNAKISTIDQKLNANEQLDPMKNDNNKLWKGLETSQSKLPKKQIESDFHLPNIQIELARHKHVGELSQFLLTKCPKLRMPTFERWLIDSKMEERKKRNLIQEANIRSQMQDEIEGSIYNKKKSKEIKWKQRLKRKRNDLKTSLDRHMTSSGRTLNDFDCVIPTMADIEDNSTQRLILEIQSTYDDDNHDAASEMSPENVCRELCQRACTAARHLQNLNSHLGGSNNVDQYFNTTKQLSLNSMGKIILKRDKKSDNDDGAVLYSLVYSRKKNKKGHEMKPFIVNINAQHYDKLRDMFNVIHSDNERLSVPSLKMFTKSETKYTPATQVFHHLVFCMLVRYAALSGGQQLLDLRGGGMQGAIHSHVFDSLARISPTNSMIECFASPLNVYNRQYCSIFYQDLDCHFGSSGDFFSVPLGHFKKYGDIHEANPPFSPGLMTNMVERIKEHLEFAESEYRQNKNDGKLTFVVVVPSCKSKTSVTNFDNLVQNLASDSYNSMIKSSFCTKHIVLKAREHGYVEGSQHLRQTRYKESQYNTSIIILQSQNAKEFERENPTFCSKEFETDIRKSFSSRHHLELDERRSRLGGKEKKIGSEKKIVKEKRILKTKNRQRSNQP